MGKQGTEYFHFRFFFQFCMVLLNLSPVFLMMNGAERQMVFTGTCKYLTIIRYFYRPIFFSTKHISILKGPIKIIEFF